MRVEFPMKKFKSRNERHTVSMLTDHMVFTPKYRGKVLKGKVARECEAMIRETCFDLEVDVLDMAVAPDHVHLFVRYPPRYSPSQLAEKIKSNTSRELRRKFPHLKQWCKKALWAPGCYHGSVGQGFEVVHKYIDSQKYEHVKRSSIQKGRK